jgi:hypothetical protein
MCVECVCVVGRWAVGGVRGAAGGGPRVGAHGERAPAGSPLCGVAAGRSRPRCSLAGRRWYVEPTVNQLTTHDTRRTTRTTRTAHAVALTWRSSDSAYLAKPGCLFQLARRQTWMLTAPSHLLPPALLTQLLKNLLFLSLALHANPGLVVMPVHTHTRHTAHTQRRTAPHTLTLMSFAGTSWR